MANKKIFSTFANEIRIRGGGQKVPLSVKNQFSMISKETVSQIVEEFIIDSEYYLVEVKVANDNKITVEIDAFEGVSIDYCVKLNKHIESLIDREIEDYELQVSSAGLTEPFKVINQYKKNIGNEVEVLTNDGKKISGDLVDVNTDEFILQVEKTEKKEGSKRKTIIQENITFKYKEIKTTKYIIRFK